VRQALTGFARLKPSRGRRSPGPDRGRYAAFTRKPVYASPSGADGRAMKDGAPGLAA